VSGPSKQTSSPHFKASQVTKTEMMRRIKSRDTAPELIVRRLLHRRGYRFRLHRIDLPGKPDIVLPGRNAIILVHGCFWHQHTCRLGRTPKGNQAYWVPKLARNSKRDSIVTRRLRALGWRVMTIWECQVTKPSLPARIERFLSK
jgi:DNA mismatch endonuclease (patch repair protein)